MQNQFKIQKLFKIDNFWALQKKPYLGIVSFNIHLNVGANWRIRHCMIFYVENAELSLFSSISEFSK